MILSLFHIISLQLHRLYGWLWRSRNDFIASIPLYLYSLL